MDGLGLDSFIENLITTLEGSGMLNDVKFVREYQALFKENPLRQTLVAVGMGSMNLKSPEDGIEVLVGVLRLNFTIHVPVSAGGDTAHDVFSRLADAVITKADDGGISNLYALGCDAMHYDRPTATIMLNTWIEFLMAP